MFEKLEIVRTAQAMARHAGIRTEVIARNVANADTPGYRARDLPDFATYAEGEGGLRTTRAGHLRSPEAAAAESVETPLQGAASPNGNSVSLEEEMVKSVSAKQQHDMALAIYQSSSRLLRTSLGRGS
ncbi:FlgB family protein [Cereibacter sphaeroides]|uniref:FlgB family protein n=1 Tax=Cereibacter sphaeroides TaxID=1063 RepID=UPI001F2E406D|nr:FlgB family protein [Cereibacter sphaeroides]MCE6960924.1 FlgB family protein [Cereibacter sphaeroides]MCE6969778.1 FlgB family protein [Cereibacter sphaeroides]MCE6975253.1 FlgB family protein [Cereibacter sphaeroides]